MTSHSITAKQGGMVLLEGLIAIVIFAFGVLALVGMQAASVRQAGDAKYRVDASFAVNQVIGQMWADRQNLGSYEKQDVPVPALPNGKRSIALADVGNGATQVTITVTWQLPGESTVHTHSSITFING